MDAHDSRETRNLLAEENESLRLTNGELERRIKSQNLKIEELQKAVEKYRLLTDNANDVLWMLDSNLYNTYISPSCEKLTGYTVEELIGTHVTFGMDEEGMNQVREATQPWRDAQARGEIPGPLTFEARHCAKEYQWHWVETSATPICDADGTITGFYGISRDITERKLAEQAIHEARAAAEQANKAKSEFLALISHEIRTPLNSLVGFSRMARATTDPAKLAQYHAILEESSRSLMELVNDILDMSKIEAGRLECEAVPFNLRQLVGSLEADHQPLAELKRLSFRMELPDTLPSWVLGDPIRVRQILANLLGNAVKFTEEGTITCTITMPGQDSSGAPSRVRFTVRDSGIGIPEQKQSLLFRPFQQVDPSISRKYGGTGLGLAIVHSLVGMMGGSISLESSEGEGSCFTVELPLPACEPLPETQPPQPFDLASGMVLVAEDNRFNRLLFEEILTDWGLQVTLAENGSEALRLLAEQQYDLILLDIRMPGIDGIEVARRIRAYEKEKGMASAAIIAVTADRDTATRDACLAAGIDDVLAKPVIPEQLARAIDAHCEGIVLLAAEPQPLLNQQIREGLAGNSDRVRQFRIILAQDINAELKCLQSALEQEDRELLRRAAHTLKGLCGQLTNQMPADLSAWLHLNASSATVEQLGQVAGQLRTVCHSLLRNEEREYHPPTSS